MPSTFTCIISLVISAGRVASKDTINQTSTAVRVGRVTVAPMTRPPENKNKSSHSHLSKIVVKSIFRG